MWRLTAALLATAVALVAAACGGSSDRPVADGCAGGSGSPHAGRAQHVPQLRHVVVVVFENKEYGEVVGSPEAPTFNHLARSGALLTNYCGVAHPSLPNYLALVSGSTQGINDDCTDCSVDGRNLADTLEHAGQSWKTYAEGLPEPGFTGAHAGGYAKKHDPLIYFRDVAGSSRRLRRIVPLFQLDRDLAADALPTFSLVVPDLCHDMHDCPVADGDRWLGSFLPRLLDHRHLQHGVVFIVFDEGDKNDDSGGGGHTVALAVGPPVEPGSRSATAVTHYNLLRTIEDALRLPPLGRSRAARPILGIWR